MSTYDLKEKYFKFAGSLLPELLHVEIIIIGIKVNVIHVIVLIPGGQHKNQLFPNLK
jgi:hypothetical protein